MWGLPGAAAGPGRPLDPAALPDGSQDLRGPEPHRGPSLSAAGGALAIVGKGNKPRLVACPAALGHRLKAFAYDRGLGPADRLFPMGRKRAWQIIGAAAAQAGLEKRVYPHLFRHSGAIERLRQTGNPRALQLHVGHASPRMTMRYLSTLTAEEALRINQEVRFED
jgi:integrase